MNDAFSPCAWSAAVEGASCAAGAREAVFFDALLYPHQSLTPAGLRWLLAGLGGVSLVAGAIFAALGLWPVLGFYGVDVLLVFVLLRRHLRDRQIFEKVRLTERHLTVERRSRTGLRGTWRFQPYWLRVRLDDPMRNDSRITLSSHGRRLTVGDFLAPAERAEFASALGSALDRWRRRGAPDPGLCGPP